jgi:hypothetical protein
VRSTNVERITEIEREASMEIFNLSALAEDRRIVREREARFERLRTRRRPQVEPVARAAKPRCTGPVEHSARPA